MSHLENLRQLAESAKEETKLMVLVALGAVAASALGITEWEQARQEETRRLQELQQAPDDQKAQADAAYQQAWRDRMDAEIDLTPAEEEELSRRHNP